MFELYLRKKKKIFTKHLRSYFPDLSVVLQQLKKLRQLEGKNNRKNKTKKKRNQKTFQMTLDLVA